LLANCLNQEQDSVKKFIIFSSLMAAATIASATTINSDCATAGGSGIPASTTTSTCPSFALPGGPVTYNSITLIYKYDADFGLGMGTVNMSHDVLGSTLGTLFDNPVPVVISDTTRPFLSSITQPGSLALAQAVASGTSISDIWSGGTGSISTVAFDYEWQVTYTTSTSSAPEPGTLGVLGAALVGLGLLRFRRS
jgi:hypothetical protein